MPHACRECGERGRAKKVMSVRGELRLYCHDDERSCFNDAIVRLSA
jgi:phosphoribosyl-AMP cyclohydrolase